jgi:hypothetical protein
MLKSNKESNALARARNRKKCYSYSVGCNAIRYSIKTMTVTGNNTNLLSANQEIVATLGVFNRPCVAHQICKGVGKAYNQINGGSANGDAFVD